MVGFGAASDVIPGSSDGFTSQRASRAALDFGRPRRFNLRAVVGFRVIETGQQLRGDVRAVLNRQREGLA